MTECEHKETFLCSLTASLWGPRFGYFCKQCGVCTTDPSVPSRPELAKQSREMDEAATAFQERWEKMTLSEREQFQLDLEEKLQSRDLSEQLKPFQGETYRPFGYF